MQGTLPVLPSAPGVCVTLRLDGAVIGQGVDLSGWARDTGDDGRGLWRAAVEAIRQADPRLPVDNDVLRSERLREVTGRVTISLELAGLPTRVLGNTWPDLEAELQPGLDGIGARLVGEDGRGGPWEVMFPAEMLARNALPHRALAGLVAETLGEGGAALALEKPRELAEKHGVRAVRFRTVHVMQTAPGSPPRILHRGARVVAAAETTEAELRRMANRLAEHLIAAERDRPSAGAADGSSALRERALAAFALARYATAVLAAEPGAAARAREAAASISVAVARQTEAADPASRPSAPLALAAFAELGDQARPEAAALRDRFGSDFASVFDRASGFDPELPRPVHGLFAYGAVRATGGGEPSAALSPEDAATCVRRIFAGAGESDLVAQMPWLGWAELRLHRDGAVPAAVALRRMREQVWKHQVGLLDAGADSPDMIGGIVFTRGATPLPTWQGVRPLAFIATMLGDSRLTDPAERNAELLRLVQSLRFLRQLQVDESSAWMYANPASALGGIRASVWDHSLPPDASSLTLLAVCEAIRGLEQIRAEQEPTPAAQPR